MANRPVSGSYADWRARLATANDPAFWPIEFIDQAIVDGAAQFWASDDAAMVTRLVTYPGGAVTLETMAATGTLAGVLALEPAATRWARKQGATYLLAAGRPGWARVRPEGWRHWQCIIIKDLADGH